MKNKLLPGLYPDLSSEQYHADPALGSSSLKVLATKTPAHLKGMVRKESTAFDVGTAFHTLVLEPAKEATIVCGPDDRRGKAWTTAKEEADAAGKLLLTSWDYGTVFRMRDALMLNPDAVELMDGETMAEASLFHDDVTGVRCKVRPDLYNKDKNIIVDLKTAVSADPFHFAKAVADYGYGVQQAFYMRIWEGFHKKDLEGFYFLVVEKEPPFLSAVYELDRFTLMESYNLVNVGLATYKRCIAGNAWPGYERGVQKLRLPSWAFKTIDANTFPLEAGKPNDPA